MVKKRRIRASPIVPESIVQPGRLGVDQEVEDQEEDGVVVEASGHQVAYDVDALIAGITDSE